MSVGQRPIIGLTGELPDDQTIQNSGFPDIIRVSTNLVTLPVSVTDSEGRAITDIDSQQFLIREDGRPETVSKVAAAGQSPLQLALLFDLSGSVNPRFQFEQEAAIRFLEKVWKPGDAISVIAFSEQPHLRLNASNSIADAFQILWELKPSEGPTAFFDSVALSAKILQKTAGLGMRQSVVALSDGEDNRSENHLTVVLREIQRSDTIFYSINPAGPSIRLNEISRQGQADLEALAKETGGSAFVSDKAEDLEGIFHRIAADLRAQYILSYYSSNPRMDGSYRQILVSIPDRPDLRIRARRGYYASIQ